MTDLKWNHPETGAPITFADRRPSAPPRDPPARFPFTMSDVAGHEARHATAGMLLGFDVSEARCDIPTRDAAGHVLLDTEGHDAKRIMVMVLVGGIGDASIDDWPPAWPLNPDGTTPSDERALAKLAEQIGLDENGWNEVCRDAHTLVERPDFKLLEKSVADLLELGMVLTGPMLEDLHRRAIATKSATLELQFKSFAVASAAAALDETGVFEATVAVFGNVDKGGDRILPGAFTKSLDKWRQAGDPIPVIFNHEWASAHAHIGTADPREMRETARGLLVKGRLDVEDNPTAAQVYRLMKRRSLKEFSFAYTVPPGGHRKSRDGANELLEIEIVEVGPTLKGMNPDTELHGVKSALAQLNPTRPDPAALRRKADELRLELLTDGIDPPPDDGRHVPTLDELREQQIALGLPAAPDPEMARIRRETRAMILRGMDVDHAA